MIDEKGNHVSVKTYPYIGGSFDYIHFKGDDSWWVKERTCRVVSHSVFCGSFDCEEAGERWELSCGHEALTEYDRPGYCPECGARLVEP